MEWKWLQIIAYNGIIMSVGGLIITPLGILIPLDKKVPVCILQILLCIILGVSSYLLGLAHSRMIK